VHGVDAIVRRRDSDDVQQSWFIPTRGAQKLQPQPALYCLAQTVKVRLFVHQVVNADQTPEPEARR
jgi:hypothetical protein